MKVCLLAPANSVHTLKIAYSLKENGNDVFIISFHKPLSKDINALYLPPIIYPFGKFNYLLNIPKIKKIIEQYRPDILHAHYISSYGFVGSLLNYHPFIVSVWGSDIFDFPNKSVLHKYLVKYALKKADFVLSTSNIMAKETQKYTDKKIFVTPFGVDCEKFKPMPELKPKDKIIIGTIKALKPNYGIEYLIRAIPYVMGRNRDVLFVIGGDGSLRKYHEDLAYSLGVAEKVVFTGRIPQEQLPLYYGASDVVVVPSLQEAWGLVATEAMASARPVIASNVGGLREQVIDGFNGFLVPPRDCKAVADRILYFLENPSEIGKMGLNGRRLAEERFDIEKRIDKIIELYNSLIRGMRP